MAQGGWDGAEHPNPRDIYALLGQAFARLAEDRTIQAAALAANVNVPEEYEAPVRDALRVHLEADGFALHLCAICAREARAIVEDAPRCVLRADTGPGAACILPPRR